MTEEVDINDLKNRIFKNDNKPNLDDSKLASLGSEINKRTKFVELLKDWQAMRVAQIDSELLTLSTDPRVPERIIGIVLGQKKAIQHDFDALLNLANKKYNNSPKKDEEEV